ncbi:DNA-formamidopyrimidine glycosylase [Salimicrobium jeotgali]|uniref:Formamidopyrimidine-DNA glycosylase n=1 Tax=Salimicrobium jeotgali TaxID=1230341 RepID=K2FMJ1_9BACI|nr:DNA-formamidopyrimidine glycosylase [Salimicrobium jeotgali]AKG04153.1 DNA-formamidopyrimidine glycosylase [Salimicrobium jeotgali]EKE32111.1 formamidopyrimidine/5-formyluracil/ 5-hydroxymethyluracil DNA glycosylase [Salimicrobium jeotgali]MBM7695721.1 formamidopyrimidine-DNA glycosylase [Salimicrobium jeotgali]
MPELPEVDAVKQSLLKQVTGKRISRVEVFWPSIVKVPEDRKQFEEMLQGQELQSVDRKGKFLILHLDDYSLVSHLRMEGKYFIRNGEEPKDKHTHIIFTFEDGSSLHYNDVRKFGTMHLFDKGEEYNNKPLNTLGPDPIEGRFTTEYMYEQLQRTTRRIKTILLDQSVVAGFGNIYVDETLFRAGVHPERLGSSLDRETVKRIVEEGEKVIREAMEAGGSTIRSYSRSDGSRGEYQTKLFVYGKEGEPCPACRRPITKTKVGGRGTHVCYYCQE